MEEDDASLASLSGALRQLKTQDGNVHTSALVKTLYMGDNGKPGGQF